MPTVSSNPFFSSSAASSSISTSPLDSLLMLTRVPDDTILAAIRAQAATEGRTFDVFAYSLVQRVVPALFDDPAGDDISNPTSVGSKSGVHCRDAVTTSKNVDADHAYANGHISSKNNNSSVSNSSSSSKSKYDDNSNTDHNGDTSEHPSTSFSSSRSQHLFAFIRALSQDGRLPEKKLASFVANAWKAQLAGRSRRTAGSAATLLFPWQTVALLHAQGVVDVATLLPLMMTKGSGSGSGSNSGGGGGPAAMLRESVQQLLNILRIIARALPASNLNNTSNSSNSDKMKGNDVGSNITTGYSINGDGLAGDDSLGTRADNLTRSNGVCKVNGDVASAMVSGQLSRGQSMLSAFTLMLQRLFRVASSATVEQVHYSFSFSPSFSL
jgi:hypothetical protein